MIKNQDKKTICPYCGSTDVGEYLYGMPVFSSELMEQELDGKIILAGCIVTEDDPGYHCHKCQKDFGKRED